VSDLAYKLTKIDTWESSKTIYGLKLTFTNSLGQTVTSPVLGDTSGAVASNPSTYTINSAKTIAFIDHYGKTPCSGIEIIYSDNTFVTVGPVDTALIMSRATLTMPFVGFRCLFTQKATSDTRIVDMNGCNPIEHKYAF